MLELVRINNKINSINEKFFLVSYGEGCGRKFKPGFELKKKLKFIFKIFIKTVYEKYILSRLDL